MRTVLNRRTWVVVAWLCVLTIRQGFAQEGDLLGFKGGYKAFSRLCEQNLDPASRLLANDYSRGYFVSLSIQPGTDTVTDIAFLTATPPEMASLISTALKGTNGQWVRKDKLRRFLIPIFFCQNKPPNDSLFSQLLVTNNVGFSVDHFPDQWPEAAEGVWLHPLTPLVTGGAPRPVPAASGSTAAAPPRVAPVVIPAGAAVQSSAQAPATTQVTTNGWPAPAVKESWPSGVIDTLSVSGVYQNKEQFDRGAVMYGSPNPVEQKGLLSWFTIDYAAFGTVRVKSANKDIQEFPVGTIYGFKNNRVNFVYVKSMKEYLAVVRTSPLLYLIMDERKESGYNGGSVINGVFLYARSVDGPFKEFTRKNIDADFGSNAQMASDMQLLRKELNKHCVQMTPGDFASCRTLAEDYLAKWETTGTK